MGNQSDEESSKIQFKKKNRKSLRKRQVLSDDNDSDNEKASLRYIPWTHTRIRSVLNKYRSNRKIFIKKTKNSFREKVEEMKIIQKLRERPSGVNVVGLALGENVTSDIITVRSITYK